MNNATYYDKLPEMIARCIWTYAKSMQWAPYEEIIIMNRANIEKK